MILGIPKERPANRLVEERRVALTPAGARELTDLGTRIVVESGAGGGAGYPDDAYREAGAQVVYSAEEALRRADVVVKVARPRLDEAALLQPGAAVLAFFHLAVAPRDLVDALLTRNITVLGYEVVREADGSLPILRPESEIAGTLAAQLAGRLLESPAGGRGILLGGVPGIPPAEVVILGGGTLGYHAARSFVGAGASVYVLDADLARLRRLDELFAGRVVTALATRSTIEKYVAFADVLIGAVLVPGRRAPVLVTRQMVERMAAGSLVIDFSIDQGGCIETSSLTPSEDFVFKVGRVTHFCAPNVPALVARTASQALTHALLPYLREIVQRGVLPATRENPALRRGLYAAGGQLSDDVSPAGSAKSPAPWLVPETT